MNSFFEKIENLSQFWTKHRYCLAEGCLERGVRLLSTSSENFRNHYSSFFLTKILNAFCHFEKAIQKLKEESPQKRKILFRLLQTKKDENDTLGIACVVKVRGYTEYMTKEHLLRAVSHLLPGVNPITDHSYQYRDEEAGLLFIYQEMEKQRGRGFLASELQQLKVSLAQELEESIESYSPSLFLVRNEEEIFRSIVQMGRELNKPNDLPQATISFQEQTQTGLLRFSVVVVRLVTPESPSLKQLSEQLPQTISFIPEMVSEIGSVDKKYKKQANIVTFEVRAASFARKNGSIDLREARLYIGKTVELMIGEFRDYNGGLFSKQNKHLQEIKEILGDSNKMFLESLFYAFTPSLFQTFILPEASKMCATLFLQAKKISLSEQKKFLFLKHQEATFSLIVLKTSSEQQKNAVMREIANFSLPLHQLGYTTQCVDGEHYLGLVYQYPTDSSLFESIEALFLQVSDLPKLDRKFLRINFQDGDPLSLNPHIGLDLRCRALQKALFEGLTRIGPDGATQLTGAKSVEILDNGTVYLFFLRKMYWSNGEEVTALQFEKSWKKAIVSPSCLRPDLFYLIKNARRVSKGLAPVEEIGVKALDKYTLKVTLDYPASYFLEMLAHPLFFPLYEEAGEPYVFNGPFTLHSWNRETSLVLIKNPYYWDFEKVKLDGIDISIIRDPHQAFQKYKKGELDWIGGPFSILPLAITNQVSESLLSVDTPGVSWLYCNLAHPLFSSAKIRRALSLSLNRKKICANSLHRVPLHTQLPKGLSLLEEEVSDYDENSAQELFKEGLKDLKRSKKNLDQVTLFHSHIAGQKELAIEVQTQWQTAFGLKIERMEKSWNTFSHKLDNRLMHLGACYRHPFYYDPMYFFQIFYDAGNIHNAFGWQNETFNTLVSNSHSLHEATKYLKLAEAELIQQMPVIPIHMVTYHYLAQKKVKGIHFCTSGDVDFRWIYFEDKL